MRLLLAIPIVLLPHTGLMPADFGMGFSLVLLGLLLAMHRPEPPHLARPAHLLPPFVALFLAMALGFVVAHWHDTAGAAGALLEAKTAVLYPFFYLAYRRCGLDLKATKQMIGLVVVVSVVAGLQAVYQGLSFDLGTFDPDQRATGPFGDIRAANRAGVFFAMFLPMLVAIALYTRHRRVVRWTAIAGSFVLVAAILVTFSRQAYLIALLASMVLLVRRSVLLALVAAVGFTVIAVSVLPGGVIERVRLAQPGPGVDGATVEGTAASRLEIWMGTVDMFREHPNGVGLGRFDDEIGHYTTQPGMDAHNSFVLVLAECGPLGLLALLWLLWRLWSLAGWLRRSAGDTRPEERMVAFGFTLAVISMVLGNLYGSAFFDRLVMANFWIFVGLIERYGLLKARAASLVATYGTPVPPPVPMGQRFPLASRALPGLSGQDAFPRFPAARRWRRN
ncbi:hypothetical protein GCM10028862_00010 [Luteimonas pelagia]